MRRVLWYDIEIAAHALKYAPKQRWLITVKGWISQAHAAHCYSKHFTDRIQSGARGPFLKLLG